MAPASNSFFSINSITLTVRDLSATRDFYRDVIGLSEIAYEGDHAILGVGDTVLVDLHHDAGARLAERREAGLFHTAFLLPTRTDLARWTRHVLDRGIRFSGAANHLVSEAIYLSDPEGNGVEVYADRPRAVWQWSGGSVAMATERLDLDDLLAAAGDRIWDGAPEGTAIGHIHLQAGSLEPAETFFGDLLGLPVTCRYRGAVFFGADGYHHHIAANIWNSRGAGMRSFPSTGLAGFEVRLHDRASLAAAAGKAGQSMNDDTNRHALVLTDPWGTPVNLTA